MTTRDRVAHKIRKLATKLLMLVDDPDLSRGFRDDLRLAALEVESAADIVGTSGVESLSCGFTEGGPTQADIRGEVKHDG